jgi:hypothetical protein
MPISKILPDGKVRIYSNTTGQVLDISPEDLPNYNPKLVGDYQKMQDQQAQVAAAQKILDSGGKVDNFPADIKAQAQTNLVSSKGVTKGVDEKSAPVLNLINKLEQNYQTAGGAEASFGPANRILGLIKSGEGMVGLNDSAKNYNDEKAGFAATLKSLTGDTGVLTDQDFARLSKLLPGLTSTSGEATGKFDDLRSQIAAKFGGAPTETTIKPGQKGITDILLGGAKKIANDSVAGVTANLTENQRNQSRDSAFAAAKYLENQAQATDDMQKRKQLLQQAQQLYNTTGNQAAQTANTFSEDVKDNPLLRGLGAATEIATIADAPTLAAGGKNLVAGGITKAKGLVGKNTEISAARNIAAQGVKLDTKSLVKAGDDYVKNVDPAAQKTWDTLKTSIKNTTSADDLLEKLTYWGDKAFTKSGDKRAITEGLLKSHLYKTGRQIISSQAPEVADLTTQMAKQIARQKILKKAGGIAGSAAAGGATYAVLGRILGQPH